MLMRDYVRNFYALVYNCTWGMGGFIGAPIEYKWTTLPPNGPAITQLLFEVHGHQIFVDGHYNADPHAGNVMICDDGRLGLIDYGNAPVLSLEERLNFAKFIVALDEKNEPEIIAMQKKMGSIFTGDRVDDLTLMSGYGDFDQQYGQTWMNRRFGFSDDATVMAYMDVQGNGKGCWGNLQEFPAMLMNLQRCLVTLNGVANATGAGTPRPSAM